MSLQSQNKASEQRARDLGGARPSRETRAIDCVVADEAGYVGHPDAAWLPVFSAGELLRPEAVSTTTEWAKVMATRAHVGAQWPTERASAIILSPRAVRGAFRTDVPVQPIVGKLAQVLCTSMTSLLHN